MSTQFAPDFEPDFAELVRRSHSLARCIGTEPMRVLITEDDFGMRALLRTALSREKQEFIIDEATDGEQGELMLRMGHYDLAIIDQILPKKNGIDVVRDLERDGIKFSWILISGHVDEQGKLEEQARRLGAHNVLQKGPGVEWFSLKQLAATVRCAIQAWRVNQFVTAEVK